MRHQSRRRSSGPARCPAPERLEARIIPAVDLAAAGLPISAAYAALATSVRAAEATLNVPPSESNEGNNASGPTDMVFGVQAAAVGTQVIPAVLTLEGALRAPFGSYPRGSFATQQALDADGLGGHLAALLNAATYGTPDGTVPKSSLPLLYAAVDAAMAESYQATASNLYLAATTPARGPAASTASITFPSVATSGTSTAASVSALAATQVAALRQDLALALTELPNASAVIQGQLGDSGLGGELSLLFAAAGSQTTDTSVPQGMLPLLYASVETALSAALLHASGAIYLDYTGQLAADPSRVIDIDAIATRAAQAFSTFATNVRAAEVPLAAATTGGPTGIGTPTTEPGIAVIGFTATAGASATTTGSFIVNLSNASTSTVTVQYATADGSAVAGTDYTATSGTLTFAPGVTVATVPVTILASSATSGTKTVILDLSSPTNATLTTASAVASIAAPSSSTGTTTTVTLTPAVTQGPYFQDFTDSTLDRSDVRTNTTRTSVLDGLPLTITFNVHQVSGTTVSPLTGARVDIWNADALGVYSDEDSEGTSGETYLRGYQATDSDGSATFTTIVPGWYSGRTPHVHFMVRSGTTTLVNRVTSQLFFPQDFIDTVDTTVSPYASRGVPDTTNAADSVFNTTTSSGVTAGSLTTLTLSGSTTAGYTATYNVYVAATS